MDFLRAKIFPEELPENARLFLIWSLLICVCSILAVFIFNPILAIVALLACGFVILSITNPTYSLFVLLLFMPLIMSLMTGFKTVETPNRVFGVMGLMILFGWVLKKMLSGDPVKWPSKWLLIYMVAFASWVLIVNIHAGMNAKNMIAAGRIFIFWIFILFMYDTIKLEDFKKYFFLVVSTILISSLFLVMKSFLKGNLLNFALLILQRQTIYAINPNVYAGLIVLFLPILIAFRLYADNIQHKYLYSLSIVILTFGLLLTNSRGGYLTLTVALLFILLFSRRAGLYYGIIAGILLIFALSPLAPLIIKLYLRTETVYSGRDIIWQSAYRIFLDNPIFGVGLGNFQKEIISYLPLGYFYGFFGSVIHAHNYFLDKMAELGFFGLLLMVYLFYKLISISISNVVRVKDNSERVISIGITAMILGYLGRSLFEAMGIVSIGYLFPDIYFWVLIIFVLKIKAQNNRDSLPQIL